MAQQTINRSGFDDAPAKDDSLSISSYINGLVGFVESCPSPMTIAVQGNWGTGKTSAMLQIKKQLDEKQEEINTIFFNTWQYSQFDLGENLAISMLKEIADELGEGSKGANAGKVSDLRKLLLRAGSIYASKTVPGFLEMVGLGMAGKAVGAAAETVAEMRDHRADELDSVKILSKLRGAFEAAVAESKRKIIIFVDDLDRLAPGRAIEVMEAIKVFLDVPNCVFVLAIDFEVVKLGVQEKYGEAVSDRKARSFFDKIIQVPFQLPVSRYDMTKLFEDGLSRAGVSTTTDSFEKYMRISTTSVGTNPRSTKRLLNTFSLLKSILASESEKHAAGGHHETEENHLHLFATLCLQTAFPEAYAALAENSGDKEPADVLDPDDDSEHEVKFQRWGIPESEYDITRRFIDELVGVFTVASKFSSEDFNKAFGQTATTSVGLDNVAPERRVRTFDREERQRRTEEIVSKEFVDLALRFEEELTGRQDAFAAQSNPKYWTICMGKGLPRIGLLGFLRKGLKLTLEFKPNLVTYEQVNQNADSIRNALDKLSDVPTDGVGVRNVPQVQCMERGDGYLVMITNITDTAQTSLLAKELKDVPGWVIL